MPDPRAARKSTNNEKGDIVKIPAGLARVIEFQSGVCAISSGPCNVSF